MLYHTYYQIPFPWNLNLWPLGTQHLKTHAFLVDADIRDSSAPDQYLSIAYWTIE